MQLEIRHRTVYSYDQPIDYAIQALRLTPRDHDGQRVRGWRVTGESGRALPQIEDGYGNLVHHHCVNRPHELAEVVAEGRVETSDTGGVIAGVIEPFPPAFYLRDTAMTAVDDALETLARETLDGRKPLDGMHMLMETVRDRVAYETGATEVTTTAAEALAAGRGVCQDHAHIFIAGARSAGRPARYVSGYLATGAGGEEHEASHAWAEAWIEDLGWVGFDPANGVSPTPAYVRVAVGLDYRAAAPVRGLWRGAGEERLEVGVRVAQTDAPDRGADQ